MFFLAVVDYAFQRGTKRQKRQLLLELYSTELQLFQDLTLQSSCWLVQYTSWNPGHVFQKSPLLFILSEHLMNSCNNLELSMSFAVFPCLRIIGEINVTLVIRTRDFFCLQIQQFHGFYFVVNPNVQLLFQFDRYNFQAWVADIICPAVHDYCDS